MTLTNKGAFELLQYMGNLHETGRLGFFIAKNMRLIKTELLEYIDIRNAVIGKYAVQKEDGYLIPKENIQSFMDEMKQYDDIACTIEPVLVDPDLFMSGTLDSNDMFNLDWMVKS